jgi:hypothetical protein
MCPTGRIVLHKPHFPDDTAMTVYSLFDMFIMLISAINLLHCPQPLLWRFEFAPRGTKGLICRLPLFLRKSSHKKPGRMHVRKAGWPYLEGE